MLVSQFMLSTVKETPADAELISHRLMLRAGMIRRLASGLYTWMPLGLRVLRRVEQVVREEMNAGGALELFMPAVQPAELWQETGRWQKYGAELLRITDRQDREFCFGPTHEEVITDIARRELKSYKQLPIIFYQIQTKFRDEIRPRFGVMRAREFMMKDAYSFHVDDESLAQTYQKMNEAYSRIFNRLGLNFRAVLADSGSIGGNASQEFHVLANSGEDLLAYSEHGDYAANMEKAEAQLPAERPWPTEPMTKIATPDLHTINDLKEALHIPVIKTVKTLIVKGAETPLVALVLRGDHQLNTVKAEHLPEVAVPLIMADAKDIVAYLGCSPGSIGPVGLKIPMIVDREAAAVADFVCGANEDGYHYTGVNWERDLSLPQVVDIRMVMENDLSPDGKGRLLIQRGIEVGHIFQLGDKYTKPMQATILNEEGKAVVMKAGCYGIGVSRVVAAAIEQNHDEHGIIWSETMAPFTVALIPMQMHKSYRCREAAEQLYQQLVVAGIEVLFDDRKERPGVMFSDMDLIGIPHRLVISEKGLDAGLIEYKSRGSNEVYHWPLHNVLVELQTRLKA